MSSETKVPMPNPAYKQWGTGPGIFDQDMFTRMQFVVYADARASERDAFWMAKVAEVKSWRDRLPCQFEEADSWDRLTAALAEINELRATLTNPRAGETA